MIKTFRNKIIDEEIQKIRLSSNNGLTGNKITNFAAIGNDPGGKTYEVVLKIFTTDPGVSTPTATIDFGDPTLVAVLFYLNNPATDNLSELQVVNDKLTFNQDLFITCHDSHNSPASTDVHTNYQLELEQVKLSKDEATMATLKDMRAGPSSFP